MSRPTCNRLLSLWFRVLLQDLKMARATFPEDQDLQVVTECLQLSQEALTFDAGELSSQLIGRIHGTGSSSLLDSARAMLDAGALPPEAVPLLSLLESFEVQHERRSKVRQNAGFQDRPNGRGEGHPFIKTIQACRYITPLSLYTWRYYLRQCPLFMYYLLS